MKKSENREGRNNMTIHGWIDRYFIDRGGPAGVRITGVKRRHDNIGELLRARVWVALRFSVLCTFILTLILGISLPGRPALALAPAEPHDAVHEAAMQLVQACIDPKTAVDEAAITTLIDYVMTSKQTRQYPLPRSHGCVGAFSEFDTKISFPRFMEYACNPFIPAAVTRPSSLRYSTWVKHKGGNPAPPATWRPVPRGGAPIIVRGMQRESDSPDLHTGVYHEYDLKRLLVYVNHKGQQALISISKQVDTSDVGKRGFVLGDDSDWTYYYSGEPGTVKKGMGWAKSFIYDYFSVGVYVETAPGQPVVRSAVFQWLRAGWSGINFVRPHHILNGMKRFSHGFTTVLESPRLPPSGQMAAAYQSLLQLPATDLLHRYTLLQQSLYSSAVNMGKINKTEQIGQKSFLDVPREQMAEELMVDYLRAALGKRSMLPKEASYR